MKGSSVALLVSMVSLVGCAGPVELLLKNAIVVDHLEGNYQVLARCTYEHLARQQAQLSMTDLREQQTVRITFTKARQTYWELSFVNEDGGRQTRLEVTIGSRVRSIGAFELFSISPLGHLLARTNGSQPRTVLIPQ